MYTSLLEKGETFTTNNLVAVALRNCHRCHEPYDLVGSDMFLKEPPELCYRRRRVIAKRRSQNGTGLRTAQRH